MAYCFFLSLIFFCFSLVADSSKDCTFARPTTKKHHKPSPIIITEETNNLFYVFGSYLYYEPNTDGIGYAITGVNNSINSNVLGVTKGNYLFPNQHASSGYKAGIGSQLGYDKLVIEASFSNWMHHNHTDNQGDGPCGSALYNGTYYKDMNNIALWNNQINTIDSSPEQTPLALTYSYVDWSQRLSLFNFCIKSDKLIGQSFMIRPQIGALYVLTKENYNIDYVFNQTDAVIDDMVKSKICSSQKAHSIGPKIGITSLFYPIHNISLFGQFFCTSALNYFKMKTKENAVFNLALAPDPKQDDIAIFNVCHSNYSMTPIIELGLGLEIDTNLFHTPSKFIIGFDQKYFFGHNYIKPPDFNSLYTPGNVSIQGLNL